MTVLSVSDNSLSYSVNQSAREILYVPTSCCTKYKAKAIIDMSIQRFSKILAVVVNLGASWYLSLENLRWLSLVCLVFLLVWVFLIRYADHNFQQLTTESEPDDVRKNQEHAAREPIAFGTDSYTMVQ